MSYQKRKPRRRPAEASAELAAIEQRAERRNSPPGVAETPQSFLQTPAKDRQVITEEMVDRGEAPVWALRMVRLAPGFYADRYGNVHISQAEVCRHFGVPPTKENLGTVVEAWNDACRAQWGAAPKITEVKE